MGRFLKIDKGGDFKSLEPGNYPAACDQVVLFGYQRTEWEGKAKLQEKLYIRWQIPSVRVQDKDGNDLPAIIGRTYVNSMFKLAWLRRHLESWRGKPFTEEEERGFDIKKLLGVPCLVQVVAYERQDGSHRTKVDAVTQLPRGMVAPQVEGATVFFDADDYSPAQFEALRPWQQEMVNLRVNMNEANPAGIITATGDPGFADDDVPF